MYDPRFARMWKFYLATSELGFSVATNNVLQLQLARERDAVPLTPNYIADASAGLAAREGAALERIRLATVSALGEANKAERAAE